MKLTPEQIILVKGKCPKCGIELQYTYGHPDFYRCPNYPQCTEKLHSAQTIVFLAQHYIFELERELKSTDE